MIDGGVNGHKEILFQQRARNLKKIKLKIKGFEHCFVKQVTVGGQLIVNLMYAEFT